jgi:hypothetical protein
MTCRDCRYWKPYKHIASGWGYCTVKMPAAACTEGVDSDCQENDSCFIAELLTKENHDD